jgi:hypothetical protein
MNELLLALSALILAAAAAAAHPASALAGEGEGQKVPPASVEAYNVAWDSLGKGEHDSMPLGNGDIGVNAWTEPNGDLVFYISKTDAWDDSARLVKVGRVRIHLDPNALAVARPLAQTLCLRDATMRVQAGPQAGASRVRVWVDAHEPVIHVEAETAEATDAAASIELWRTSRQPYTELQCSDIMTSAPANVLQPTIIEPDAVLTAQQGRIGWYHHNVKSFGPAILAKIQGLEGFKQADPLLGRTFGAVIKAEAGRRVDDLRLASPRGKTHRFSIYVLTRHPSTPEKWLSAVDETIRRVEAVGAAKRRSAHEAWWAAFWDRSYIRAVAGPQAMAGKPGPDDAAYVSQMYHLQRFINACAGRGAYPIKFNGSIFTVAPLGGLRPAGKDADYRQWGPGYWWQNTRLPYIGMCASGDFDLMKPLWHMYAGEVLEISKFRTKLYLGHDGAFLPECIYFWGPVFSETYGWQPWDQRADKLQVSGYHKWEWVGGLELCWMMLDYYDHTRDREFLARTVVPFSREILTFFDQHYKTNEAGKLVMHPSQALETWWDCTNPMPELAGCVAVADRLLALPDAEAPAAERTLWRRLRDKLPDLPTRQIDGKTALAPAEKFAQKSNSENPELYGVFPFRLVALGRPNLDWGIEALRHREDRGASGWRQDDVFMAYLGLADEARTNLVARARAHDGNERFPAFWGPNYDWTPDQDHGGILMKAFQAMLMQTDGEKIFLVPAWPKDWDVDFRLHAPRQTVIEGRIRGGKVLDLKVTPAQRKKDVILP